MSLAIAPLNKDVLFYENYQSHVKTVPIFNNLSNLSKFLRAYTSKHISKDLVKLWFNEGFKNIGDGVETVLIFDSPLSVEAANYLHKKYPCLRIIYWFWNHMYHPEILTNLNSKIEKWSYDPVDCQKYNLNFNTQFYFKDFVAIKSEVIKWDFLFVGAEKGRKEYIDNCRRLIDNNHLSYNFRVSGNSRSDRIRNWLHYDKIVDLIRQSKCVVDIVPDIQKGLTLRPLEALFHNKKLITNYKGIEMIDFYNPNNIFILGKDDEQKLQEFLSSPYVKISDEIKEFYNFDNWINRFNIYK